MTAAATTFGSAALGPDFFLGDGVGLYMDLPLKMDAKGEEILWCPLTQVSSLYIDSRIPVIQITSSVERAQRGHTNSDWAEFYIQNHRKKYSLQLCNFTFFRLRSFSMFPRRSLKPVWWGQISGELESNSNKVPFVIFSFIQVIPTHKVQKQELVQFCNHQLVSFQICCKKI